ncbi:tail fiber assembly protein [Paraburkholderia mimosarum]|uniref:tail fiber assembly protein n=1 Tax=Paraburkholderia mimosarum TaxID=312026 RepID=UPI0007C48D63|nr:tail fiber assembly protein [Paraburkholderia mimosarum]
MSQKFAHLEAERIVIGFYDHDIHGVEGVPADAVEITDETHRELLDGQSAGKIMSVDEQGGAVLLDPPPPTDEQLAAGARSQRDALLFDTDWVTTRQSEVKPPPLSQAEYFAVLAYRQALRDVPQQAGFPQSINWPVAPEAVPVPHNKK